MGIPRNCLKIKGMRKNALLSAGVMKTGSAQIPSKMRLE